MKNRIVRIKEACFLTGLSRSTLFRLEKSGAFPKKIKISQNACGFILSDIEQWIEDRPKA